MKSVLERASRLSQSESAAVVYPASGVERLLRAAMGIRTSRANRVERPLRPASLSALSRWRTDRSAMDACSLCVCLGVTSLSQALPSAIASASGIERRARPVHVKHAQVGIALFADPAETALSSVSVRAA